MRRSHLLIIALFTLFQSSYSQNQLPLVPYPAVVKTGSGVYKLKDQITLKMNFPEKQDAGLFEYLRSELKNLYNIELSRVEKGKADLSINSRRMPTGGRLAYELITDRNGVTINANFEESAFHAIQTLLQLIPESTDRSVPYVEIFDYPRFEYRGMHLDVGRHFFPVSFVKRYIDYLARHKFNRFHWHLTEDQGWRIEIKQYPGLTSIGGWRNGTIVGRYPGTGSDNKRYGGFFTQEEIKEVVAYAQSRHIEVIPEIEMPGHSSAAIAAYPWLSCFPDQPTHIPENMISDQSREELKSGRIKLVQETWGVFDDVFCAGKDSTFLFLENVVDEVAALFPSKYFHIGGDESPKTHWKKCPQCQKRIKDLNLKDEHELQSYFVQRMEKHLNKKGKTLIGWDEILEGGLAPRAIVMSWRGEKGGIEAAKAKHEVIMTPTNPMYFDYTQTKTEDSVTIGGFNPIENIYNYNPVPAELSLEERKYILGAQANLWTEYIEYPSKVEYMIFPRMSALSEVLWTPIEGKNFPSFLQRLETQKKRYERWGSNYFGKK